jgi:ribosomal protein L5
MNYNIINDYLIKVPSNNPYNKPNLSDAKVVISNNSMLNNTKLLLPLINTSMSVTGQYPLVLNAKKSVASFKLRKGSPVGLLTTLRGARLINYLNLLNIYYLPTALTIEGSLGKKGGNCEGSTYSFGMSNVSIFSFVAPLEESLQVSHNINKLMPTNLTGGNTQLTLNYTMPKGYAKGVKKFIHKYFWSTLYLPITK